MTPTAVSQMRLARTSHAASAYAGSATRAPDQPGQEDARDRLPGEPQVLGRSSRRGPRGQALTSIQFAKPPVNCLEVKA